MKPARPSVTAAIVATSRSLAAMLPRPAHIAPDPYGARFLAPWVSKVIDAGEQLAMSTERGVIFGPVERFVLYMQLRTRAIDEILLDFARKGGRQVVLLGAGYDCRALRFRVELRDSVVFEVDHPATQEQKKRGLEGTGASAEVRWLGFDFEAEPVDRLPAALKGLELDPTLPTLTIWEGVTMYLSEPVIDATVRAVHEYSAPGSPLAITYTERRALEQPNLTERVMRTAVAAFGEPFTFGWDPAELGAWFEPRGFELAWTRGEAELADRMLPPPSARRVRSHGRQVALLHRR